MNTLFSGCKIFAFLAISILFFNDSFSQNLAFSVDGFIKAIDKEYKTKLTRKDSSIVIKYYSGDFRRFLEQRNNYFIPNVKRTIKWQTLSLYLLMDSVSIINAASKIGFNHPWYFLKFLRADHVSIPQKIELLQLVRKRAHARYNNSQVYKMKNNELLDFIHKKETLQYRANQHKH